MSKRPPGKGKRGKSTTPAAIRRRRYLQRIADHKIAVTVEIDETGIDWLIKEPRVLHDSMKLSRREIGDAISRMIRHSSRN
jgi:hypothetical protein